MIAYGSLRSKLEQVLTAKGGYGGIQETTKDDIIEAFKRHIYEEIHIDGIEDYFHKEKMFKFIKDYLEDIELATEENREKVIVSSLNTCEECEYANDDDDLYCEGKRCSL